MGYSVIVTPPVRERLSSTIDYLVTVECEPGYAQRLLDGVDAAIKSFKRGALFPVVDVRASEITGTRVYKRKIDSYKLLYVIDDENELIKIFSFINDRQDDRRIVSFDYSSRH